MGDNLLPLATEPCTAPTDRDGVRRRLVDRDPDLVVDVMMAVAGRMSSEPLPADARPIVAAMAVEEDRVVLRCRPYETCAQPPRHLHRNDQEEQITHWVSATVPWEAPDPSSR